MNTQHCRQRLLAFWVAPLVLALLRDVAPPTQADEPFGPELPRTATPDEALLEDELRGRGLRATPASPPPTGSLVCPGEYEPTETVLFSYKGGSGGLSIIQQMARWITTTGNSNVVIAVDPATSQATRTGILNSIAALGGNTARVSFLDYNTNAVWMRDYGPRYAYESGVRVILDHDYNRTTRTLDDAFPPAYSTSRRHARYHTGLLHGGGNYHLATSGMQPGAPAFAAGHATRLIVNENPALTEPQIVARLAQYWGVGTQMYNPFRTSIDGTQHIDMWMQVIDHGKVMLSDWPNNAGIPEDVICDNAAAALALQGYQVFRVPAYSRSWSVYTNVHCTYTNVVMCNNLVLIPLYNDSSFFTTSPGGGAPSPNNAALAAWQAALPDKTIVQIDCDALVTLAGVMHCIMMHVPAHRGPAGVNGGLAPTVLLRSPNGGQTLGAGSSQTLRWIADDDAAVASFDILLTTDGANYTRTLASNLAAATAFDASDGSFRFTWSLPPAGPGQFFRTDRARVRVVARDAAGNTASDESDAAFTINGPDCRADVNFSSAVDADDIFVFLNLWFAQLSAAPPVDPAPPAVSTDFDGSGVIDADDIFTFLNLWFAGC